VLLAGCLGRLNQFLHPGQGIIGKDKGCFFAGLALEGQLNGHGYLSGTENFTSGVVHLALGTQLGIGQQIRGGHSVPVSDYRDFGQGQAPAMLEG
jgi:hypothetical protein